MRLTGLLIALAVLVLFVIALKATATRAAGRKATGDVKARQPLTEREQSMYFRLTAAFPEHVVLAQVAFSALLQTKDRPTRNTFDRKVADFVLCTKSFNPIAVIELDDQTHRGREAKDSQRDALLTRAGYRVMRFANVPDSEELKSALAAPAAA